jgi:hypothetical protein
VLLRRSRPGPNVRSQVPPPRVDDRLVSGLHLQLLLLCSPFGLAI